MPSTADFHRDDEHDDASAASDSPPSSSSSVYYSKSAVALILLVPAIGGFLYGYDIAATSFVLQGLTTSSSSSLDDAQRAWSSTIIAPSPAWQGLVVALSSVGAWFSSGCIAYKTSSIGRRTELQLGGLLYMAGASLEAAAARVGNGRHHDDAWIMIGLLMFLAGRLIYGFGIGITMHAAPTYLGEMCPVSIRGWMVSLKEACIVLGMVLGYWIGAANTLHWQTIYTSTLPLSCAMWFFAVFAIPESAQYLLLQNPIKNELQALQSLEFVFAGGTTTQQQLRDIQVSIALQQQKAKALLHLEHHRDGSKKHRSRRSSWQQWMENPHYRLPLIAGLGLVVLQQVTGQPSVLSYATQILEQAGLMKSAAAPIALFKLVATMFAASVVERFGRVKLLLLGCQLMLAALLILAFYFGGELHLEVESTDVTKYLVLLALFLYIGGYQVGFGPVTWLMTSEVFPLAIRGQAVALSVQLNFLLNAVVQYAVPVLRDAIGLAWTFGIFALLTIYSLYFIRHRVPETKGLTLAEIEQLFQSSSSSSSSSSSREETTRHRLDDNPDLDDDKNEASALLVPSPSYSTISSGNEHAPVAANV